MAKDKQNTEARETQKKWEDRIKRAQKFKEEDFLAPFKVQLGISYYEGKQKPAGWNDAEWITINKIFSHLRTQLPLLYSVDPYFYIKLKRSYKPEAQQIALQEFKAEKRQAMVNYLKTELDLKSKARLGIQDAHFSYGVLKTHYTADMVDNEDSGKEIFPEDAEEGTEPLKGDDGNPLMEPEQIPINERYVISRINPDDMLWSEDAGPLIEKWPWLAERIVMTKDEALKNKWIDQSALKDAPKKTRGTEKNDDGMVTATFTKVADSAEKKDPDQDVYVGWEIYDLDKSEWLMIIEDADEPIRMPGKLPPGTEDHPYSILRFVMRPKSPYPIPPVSQALDIQTELNMARSRVQTHRKRFNRKYVLAEGQFADPEEAASQLENGGDGTVIKAQGGDARTAVSAVQDASLDQQSFQEIIALSNDIVEALGSSGEARGLAESESATQAALIDKRLEIREGDMMGMVVEWVGDVARKLDQLIQVHFTNDEAVKVTGPNGEEQWEEVLARDFQEVEGEFQYDVNVGSTLPRLPQVERSQWMAFLQILGAYPQLMANKRLMMKMAEMHHIEDEPMIDELVKLGQQALRENGAAPPGGGGGSQAGVSTDNPIAATMGQAFGDQGGNTNGGGSPQLASV